ncbi:unnamed protein product [Rotaria sp. Silwood1]|nr:unnamed protein product [Rotaria sp. Silwood1]CAF1308071.1 unnamed protein product [Rotaria sp. Silwood1]CAF1617701.1 unnamed protein product [Rotaria sp. Silwood1]CAF1633412.1 unnamed protein product [Rotaria sp. Silwood1]CAF3781949.1 unnamed protein product [Rotaria sp. Silwood1]
MFAALDIELFGKLECSEQRPCAGLDKHAHFKDFGMSFLTLFRIATGDNWNGKIKKSNRMMSDDTEIDEEIEQQLEVDAYDRDYLE